MVIGHVYLVVVEGSCICYLYVTTPPLYVTSLSLYLASLLQYVVNLYAVRYVVVVSLMYVSLLLPGCLAEFTTQEKQERTQVAPSGHVVT